MNAVPVTPRRLRLGSRAFYWLLPGLVLAVVMPRALASWSVLAYDLGVLCLFWFDARRIVAASLEVRRELEPHLRIAAESPLVWHVHNTGPFWLRVMLKDQAPEALLVTPDAHDVGLAAGAKVALRAQVLPARRGRTQLGDLALRIQGRLALASVLLRVPARQELKVLPAAWREPNQAKGPRRELGAVVQRLSRASQGTDLESLREYVSSDPLRAIDWKSTARRHRPVTRLFQVERSQTLWLVLDTSRTMAAAIGSGHPARPELPRTRFDVAVEAALALADGALRAGDQVGALIYSDGRQGLIAPGRGRAHYRHLLDVLCEIHAAPVQLDVRGLVKELERSAKKRSLVMLFTDLENESHGAALCAHAQMLTKRHLTVCVSLDDSDTAERAARPPQSDEAVYHQAAAIDLLEERTELRARLEKRGIMVLEADERGLARAALERYLQVKLKALL